MEKIDYPAIGHSARSESLSECSSGPFARTLTLGSFFVLDLLKK
jgi:hypothetical protein